MTSFRLRILAQTLPFLLIAPVALAQAPAKAPSRGQATAALNQPANPGAAAHYTRQQIDQMVAPIALYPDQVLGQVLMAATYPQQVVEAAQWRKESGRGELKGDALAQALEPLPWDPSVKALMAFPQIIEMMSDHIEWTQALGVAFATQQAEVMSRVQALRQLAMRSGKLKQVKHLSVRQEGPAIVITPADSDRVYIPVYNPTVVYGQWADREFPPVFLPPPQGFVAETIEPGFEVSAGYGIVRPLWGWSAPDWRANRIMVNTVEYTRITRNAQVGPGNVWRHSGPVVLVAPSTMSRTTVTTTNIPAGTVAPGSAVAVTKLPQRAAAQPNLIQSQTTTTQPGQTSTTTAQPTTTAPSTTTAQPTTTQPDKTPTTTAQPTTAQPGKTSATPTPPDRAAGKSPHPGTEQAGTSRPSAGETDQKQPTDSERAANDKAAGEKTGSPGEQPGRPEARSAPAEHKPGQPRPGPSEAGKNRGPTTPPAANLPKEQAPAAAMTSAPEQARPRAPEQPGKPPAALEHRARAPEHADPRPSMMPQESPARVPEHAGATPPAPGPTPPAREAQRPPEPAGQGTSAPPAGAPLQAAPGAQRPHEPGAGTPGPKSEQGEKKER